MVLCAFSILLHVKYIQNFDRSLLGTNNMVTSFELIAINSKLPRLLPWSKLNDDFAIKESIIIYVVNWPYKCLKSFLPPGRKNSLLMIVMVFFLAVLVVGSFFFSSRSQAFSPFIWSKNIMKSNTHKIKKVSLLSSGLIFLYHWIKQRTSLTQATIGSGMSWKCTMATKLVKFNANRKAFVIICVEIPNLLINWKSESLVVFVQI